MPSFESEKLQETILDLLRSQERESQLRDENEAILAGVSAMAGANNKRQVFNSLLEVIRKFIFFENAIVLTREDEIAPIQELVSTNYLFEGSVWPVFSTFSRCINGESVALFNPEAVEEFQSLPPDYLRYCKSALVTGVKVSSGDALLIFLHSEKGQFTPKCRRVLDRLRPLVERAIIDIDYRERLQSLVTARTQELIHSQQRFKDFAKTVGDWFWEIDTAFNFTYISSPQLAGHMIDQTNILDIFRDQPELKQKLKEKCEQQEPFEDFEWQLPESEGGLWITFTGTPYFDKNDHFLGYRGTSKNITARKKRLFDLQEARKQAESANSAKSQFLAMMSHEIRTPLNAVLGLMDTLADSGLRQEQMEWVKQMDQSAQLLLTIINDILDLSKIESGNFELTNGEMSITDCINLVVNQLSEQARNKNILLQAEIDQTVPSVICGDKNRIAQIMFNLIGNAIKFTSTGSVRVLARRVEDNIEISVIDTGIGIAKQAQNNLFHPFHQADSSITRKYGGTGLGLAISKHLISKMNGKIELDSSLGIGSCFKVILPIVVPLMTIEVDEPEQYPPSNRCLNILLAEDSITNQMVARLMLEKRGHKVHIVNNGEEALEAIRHGHKKFDLVFMDVSMPLVDGVEATRIVRSEGIEIPIIALTANVMKQDQIEYNEAGMNEFLPKPIRGSELTSILQKYQHIVAN
ncbi:response regulator [Photobacterium damselae]|uniref:ATP-binding protein n=1 Tax=Photobacterium damselae TaxID=38293 RepID=UPI00254399E7